MPRGYMMKKLMTLVLVAAVSAFSASAMACPKGTSLTGGVGPTHKGGKCVSNGLLKLQNKQKAKLVHPVKHVVRPNTKHALNPAASTPVAKTIAPAKPKM